jgi:CheY-like chemotaxis protein
LIVAGEKSFRSGLAANLRDDAHGVNECDAPEALPRLEALASVDAVLIDYQPAGDWLRLARRFHRLHPRVPIVLATAQWAPPLERAARNIGSVVCKPIDYDELHELLHRLTLRARKGRGARPGALP